MSGIIGGAGSKSGVIGTTEIDYEEGTWTPSLSCGYNCHLWGIASVVVSNAIYTKIGNICRFSCKVYVTKDGSQTTNSSNINFTGFPFAVTHNQHGGAQLHCPENGDFGYLQHRSGTGASPLRDFTNSNLGNTINPVTYYVSGAYIVA